ncbi:hypothetical protein BOX15_Mlig032670g1, partial [Macrostomum lignano]
ERRFHGPTELFNPDKDTIMQAKFHLAMMMLLLAFLLSAQLSNGNLNRVGGGRSPANPEMRQGQVEQPEEHSSSDIGSPPLCSLSSYCVNDRPPDE